MTGTERYTHGYHEAILEFYRLRTAEVCAAFLLPYLAMQSDLVAISAAFLCWADHPSGFGPGSTERWSRSAPISGSRR